MKRKSRKNQRRMTKAAQMNRVSSTATSQNRRSQSKTVTKTQTRKQSASMRWLMNSSSRSINKRSMS